MILHEPASLTFLCYFPCRILKCLVCHLTPTLLLKEIHIGSDRLTVLATIWLCTSALENLPFQLKLVVCYVFFPFNTCLSRLIMSSSIFLYVASIMVSYLVVVPLNIKIETIVTVSSDCDFIILY